jgi:hypothetical protein
MTAEQRAPGFAFARQLRDPDFRRRLMMTGYRSGMPIVPIAPEQDWEDAIALLDGPVPALLARQNDNEPHGWELRYWLGGWSRPTPEEIG